MDSSVLQQLIFLRGRINRVEATSAEHKEYKTLLQIYCKDELSLWGLSLNDTKAVFHDLAETIGALNQ